jgi:cytochrome P450
LSFPTDDLSDRLVKTKAVIEEAMRLYPPISALSRTAIEDDILGNVTVKSRSLIVVAPYVLHRHQDLWNRPNAFDPSRFLSDARAAIPRFAYLPFGVGPRTCIGSSFALQEATIVLAALSLKFNFKLPPNVDVWPLQRMTIRPAKGLPMIVSRR